MGGGLAPAHVGDGPHTILVLGVGVQTGNEESGVGGVGDEVLTPHGLLHVTVRDPQLLVADDVVAHVAVGLLWGLPGDQQAGRGDLFYSEVTHSTRA